MSSFTGMHILTKEEQKVLYTAEEVEIIFLEVVYTPSSARCKMLYDLTDVDFFCCRQAGHKEAHATTVGEEVILWQVDDTGDTPSERNGEMTRNGDHFTVRNELNPS